MMKFAFASLLFISQVCQASVLAKCQITSIDGVTTLQTKSVIEISDDSATIGDQTLFVSEGTRITEQSNGTRRAIRISHKSGLNAYELIFDDVTLNGQLYSADFGHVIRIATVVCE